MAHRQAGIVASFVAIATLASARASAQTFAVSAEIVEGCALANGAHGSGLDLGELSFGSHPAMSAGTPSASVIAGGSALALSCTPGLVMQVAVSGGLHESGGQRRLELTGGQTAFVPYALYASPGQTSPIPVSGAVDVTVPPSGTLNMPIYGVATLPGGGLLPGVYSDTLQVTVSW